MREVGWLPCRLGRLNSSRTRRLPSELIVRIGTSLVVGGRRHGGAVGHRRELSDPGIRARLAGAALRASALTPIAQRDTPENRIAPRNDVRPRTADYENETYSVRRNRRGNSWGQFCCVRFNLTLIILTDTRRQIWLTAGAGPSCRNELSMATSVGVGFSCARSALVLPGHTRSALAGHTRGAR